MQLGRKQIFLSLLVVFVVAVLFFGFRFLSASGEMRVELNGETYEPGSKMRVSIKNNFFAKELCLSSCYPYFLQKKNGAWQEFSYRECSHQDRVRTCLSPQESRVFETVVPKLFRGVYRLSVPVCRGCGLGTVFQESERFYSDIFKIR